MKGKIGRPVLWAVTAAAAAWTLAGSLPAARGGASQAPLPVRAESGVLDINAATAAQLDELPGIGPVLAGRILDARAESGPFDGPEALMAVNGVGPALWEDMAPYVYFGGTE